ncbi:MAG: VOC family protein [Myxococcales bacterium]|nr:VOC family protein [Myxococcales bacterium]
MIQRLSTATVYVLDQDSALDFYTNKLGMEVRTDARMGDFRWLTVGARSQPDLELVLMPIQQSPMWDEKRVETMRELVQAGAFGIGVLRTDDCKRTYDELSAKGVKFRGPPTERPWGLEAMLLDDSGNWFSLLQEL